MGMHFLNVTSYFLMLIHKISPFLEALENIIISSRVVQTVNFNTGEYFWLRLTGIQMVDKAILMVDKATNGCSTALQ